MSGIQGASGVADEQEVEWRVIPHCSGYKISREGEVRKIATDQVLRKSAGSTVNVYLDEEQRYSKRNVYGLFKLAFPEVTDVR
jgi:hypothetical protein